MDNICQYSECDNVIRGRRTDAKYCSESCKQNNKRKNRLSVGSSVGTGIGTTRRRRRAAAPVITGNVMNDIAANSAMSLVGNVASGLDPMASVSASAMETCIPYAIESIKKNPFISLGLGLIGFKAAASIFKSCTVIEKTVDGKTVKEKSCSTASGLQKAGGAAALIIGGNYFLDLISQVNRSDTDNSRVNSRVRHVSDTGLAPLIAKNEVSFSAS